MVAPVVFAIGWGILKLAAAAVTLYELGGLVSEIYDGAKQFDNDLDKSKKEVSKIIESIKDEIGEKIDAREEVAILLALAAQDPQGHHTRRAGGRGAGANIINTAIEQKIPFRDAISKVCEAADSMPILSLRRKKGVTIQDLPRAKRRAMEALLRLSLEELADINLDEFFFVRLRQLAASLLFEFMDECLEWNSPLKCEVNFGPPARYADHPVTGTTRLLRSSTKINPFYPAPYQRRRGNIAADLIITESRHERPDKGNIFAIVEIKFQNDRIETEQFLAYEQLLKSAATYKTAISPVRFDNRPVSSGGRLSLFRYPEDVAVHGANETRQEPHDTHQTSSRRKKKTP